MVWPLATHVLDRYLFKMRINQRGEHVAGVAVAVLHLLQQESDLIRLCLTHSNLVNGGYCISCAMTVGIWRDSVVNLMHIIMDAKSNRRGRRNRGRGRPAPFVQPPKPAAPSLYWP